MHAPLPISTMCMHIRRHACEPKCCLCVRARAVHVVCARARTRAQVHGQQNMVTKLKSMHFACGCMLLRVRVYDVRVFVCARGTCL